MSRGLGDVYKRQARPQQRYGLKQIGLARPVLADENDRARVEVKTCGRVVAKVRELQRADRKGRRAGLGRLCLADLCVVFVCARGHTRIGFCT